MTQSGRNRRAAAIEQARVSAIIRTREQALAHDAMTAAVEGGFRMIEFTLTTPGAIDLIAQFSRRTELIVGAGTVLRKEQAREAVAAGAGFLVSPIVDPQIVAEAHALDVPCIPGAFTPTEMQAAHLAGADFVKVFPAPPGGVAYIEAVRAPLPHLKLFPTAGVTAENLADFLTAGCAGAGFVKALFDPDDMARRDWGAIRNRAGEIHQHLAAWRGAR
jgi:2-dehydro-3-deoxyphosphogluconate aldolase/(4S)-4-hydroxy-2-oxoglutarate aldolase